MTVRGLGRTRSRPVRIAMFTLEENYQLGPRHFMKPETVSPLDGYLRSSFSRGQVEFVHIDSNCTDPASRLGDHFDIVGINAHWKGIRPVLDALDGWPLSEMAPHVFIEGSFLNALRDGRNVMAQHLRDRRLGAHLVFGETEPAVEGLVEHVLTGRALDSVPNLLLPENDWQGPSAIERTDLSRIEIQPYQHLDDLLRFPFHTFHIETSRGCYWGACTFCTDTKLWGRGWRGYPVENVISTFADMRRNGVDYAFIFDKDFWGNDYERAEALALELINTGNPIPFLVALRADEILNGEGLLDRFKEGGLAFVFVGAETFSLKSAKRYHKGVTVGETLAAIKVLRRHQLDFGLGHMTDPLGSLEDLMENYEVIKTHRLWGNISSVFNVLEIRSGTGYETMARRAGVLGELDVLKLAYQCDFADPRVAKLFEIGRNWDRPTQSVTIFLLIAKRMTHRVAGQDQAEYRKYNKFLERFKKIEFDFMYELAKLIKQGDESQAPLLIAEATRRHQEALQDLRRELNPDVAISRALLDKISEEA